MPLRILKMLLNVQCRSIDVYNPPALRSGSGATAFAENTFLKSKSESARSSLRSNEGRPENELLKLAPDTDDELSSIECAQV
jgi:hypothetical protein